MAANAEERAYRFLSRQLRSRRLTPGMRLSEPGLARELGISRTPVRSAIRRLEMGGLLRQVPKSGTFVCDVQPGDAEEILGLRMALEPFAIRLAAERATPAQLARLGTICEQLRLLAHQLRDSGALRFDATSMDRHARLDYAFHLALWRAAGSRRLWYMLNLLNLHQYLAISQMWFAKSDEPLVTYLARQLREHYTVYLALRRGDAEAAANCLSGALQRSYEGVRRRRAAGTTGTAGAGTERDTPAPARKPHNRN